MVGDVIFYSYPTLFLYKLLQPLRLMVPFPDLYIAADILPVWNDRPSGVNMEDLSSKDSIPVPGNGTKNFVKLSYRKAYGKDLHVNQQSHTRYQSDHNAMISGMSPRARSSTSQTKIHMNFVSSNITMHIGTAT